ncbi:protein N-lysine methyltransferase METTL21D [Leptinotarsa decemlineata]|uniref:protein N-lysine methyltransferase METTL21D n=1 Tax=Leptinotarsa decemlineata TaxID=7539 RepID=UPI003D30C56C
MEDSYIRELEIESISKVLRFYQKLEGDVSCVVWDAAIVLAKYLETLCQINTKFLVNKNVIELGAGVGCVGITAACLGANVLLTDLPVAIPLMSKNVETNKVAWQQSQGNVETMTLIWGEEADIKCSPDIILLTDCIYYKESIDSLIITLKELAMDDTTIFLTQELRDTEKQKNCWEYFVNHIKDYFEFHLIPREEQNPEFNSADIVLIKLVKI